MNEVTMSASAPPASIVRAAEEGERRWFFGGGVHIWKATAEETGGAFLLFEDRLDQGKVTPLHIHPDSDESMMVLEGEILMHLDGVEHRVAAGGVAVAPRGVPHAFKVTGPDGSRLLCLHTPGCCQAFYWDASEPIADNASESGTVDMGRVQASARKNGGIEILGPPPFS
jgi:quercetin dioxygenase-like cupin family protein